MALKFPKILLLKKPRLAILFLIVSIFLLQTSSSFADADELKISASSGILMDSKTGRILWEKNSNTKRSIASTTKMMTAIVALENVSLDKVVTTSPSAADVGEAEIYLSPGEKITVENLLYGILLKSGNDAATVLAEYVGGSVDNFIKKMNKKAIILGADKTKFLNPTGLEQEGHFSTAYDLSLIARHCLQNKKFAEIVSTKKYTIPWLDNSFPRELTNHNKLLLKYDYVDGIKTGYTKKAGYCLVASATKDGKKFISVVLNASTSEDCYADSKKILDYGFDEFELESFVKKGDTFKLMKLSTWENELNLVAEKDIVLLTKKESDDLEKIVSVNYPNLPVLKGQKVGEITISFKGEELAHSDLLADKNIIKSNFLRSFFNCFNSFFEMILKEARD
ncbi:MAG TPA: D-alanyl-D-alanine carboxypeptidase [Ignavibacteria bacterium]|nr:D-alanyl-D-alanine carboxypeptidase [Ignavibacteria bacterium]